MARSRSRIRLPKWRISRDSVLFFAGLLGVGYETIFQHTDRPTLLVLFGAMIGLPAFLRTDAAEDEPEEIPVRKPPVKKSTVKKPPVKKVKP